MTQPARRPNILLLTSDQQHWNTLGRGNPEIRTPHLDRLAAQGTAFERAYCPNPTCTPTRASMITGKYPSQHGAWTLGTKLPEDQPTLGQHLGAAGYTTSLVGKAHFQPLASTAEHPSIESYPLLQDLDFWRDFHGPYYGFDHVELARNHTAEAHAGQHYALWLEQQGCADWRRYFRPPTGTLDPGVRHTWPIPEELHYNAWIAERTGTLLEGYAEGDEPFFCWASFFDPHPPYLVPEPWDRMYDPDALTVPEAVAGEHDGNPPHFGLTQQDRPDFSPWQESGQYVHGFHSHRLPAAERRRLVATYYGMVSMLDAYVGRILDRLDALGLAGDTIVVFTTDHGHFFGQHGLQAKGAFHYEDLLRVPFLARLPGRVPAGRASSALVSTVDLAPTFLELAGLPVPREMTGVSQAEVLTGGAPSARDHVICEFRHEPTAVSLRTYVDDRYKLTVYQGRTYGELFDLRADPGETRNLWDDPGSAGLKSELLLRYIWAELGKEPMWMPRVAAA
ncbi:sulfatase family protein [Streptomyces sp. CMB-StM0423]|uniref:sulfatase family protein n=1 Tax=Streptomyces sp. CMB-StM0423 TaxID=2059884 RepID=UPI000C7081FB|nr:sulfatase-like hydrolase/transferase [Streptomyces sp. CMB-StM0423]AUH39270.1 sulfatase [Streptomyces sp. CMB-StM0423]